MDFRRQLQVGGLLIAAFGAAALSACSKQDNDVVDEQVVGSLDLALSAGDTELTSLTYKITGNGFTKEGSIPVSGAGNVFSALITGIPAGTGYTITLNASDAEGALTCTGTAMFDVTGGGTTSVSVNLQCPGVRRTGSVMVNGEINVCAVVEAASSGQASVPVGATVDLNGIGSDEDGGPGALTYQWSVISGPATLASANQSNAKLTCDAVGKVTVKLEVTDSDCGDSATLDVICEGDGPVAGSPAEGGSGGSEAGAGGSEAGAGGDAGGAGGSEAGAGGSEAGAGGSEAGTGGSEAGAGGDAGGTGGSEAGTGGSEAGTGGDAGGGGGCSEGAAEPVSINFRGTVNGAAFACGQTYSGVGSDGSIDVTPRDFRMFVQDVKLVREDGVEVPVTLEVRTPWQNADVVLLDFENGSGDCFEGNPETNTVITGTVPSSSCAYTGVKFATGIPAALNHADPNTAPPPVSTYKNLSWSWLTGFRFTKFEMAQVVSPGELFGQGLLHIGSTACSGNPNNGSVNCAKPNRNAISLTGFDPDSSTVAVDIAAAFADTDLKNDTQCHSAEAVCAPMFSAMGVNYSSGQPAGGQTVFSVE